MGNKRISIFYIPHIARNFLRNVRRDFQTPSVVTHDNNEHFKFVRCGKRPVKCLNYNYADFRKCSECSREIQSEMRAVRIAFINWFGLRASVRNESTRPGISPRGQTWNLKSAIREIDLIMVRGFCANYRSTRSLSLSRGNESCGAARGAGRARVCGRYRSGPQGIRDFYGGYYSDRISFGVFVVVVDKRYSCINPLKIRRRPRAFSARSRSQVRRY